MRHLWLEGLDWTVSTLSKTATLPSWQTNCIATKATCVLHQYGVESVELREFMTFMMQRTQEKRDGPRSYKETSEVL